ncbi:hypothetical protein TNCV_1422001 [Trichonephila clavipes]|nr:hypothetical protein TNCV_1422001 [Trichonephila clavipes]
MGNPGHFGSYSEAHGESRSCRLLFREYSSTGLAWQRTRPASSAPMPGWMATTCSKALDLMNTRLTKPSVGNERLGVKWPRSQARALDE